MWSTACCSAMLSKQRYGLHDSIMPRMFPLGHQHVWLLCQCSQTHENFEDFFLQLRHQVRWPRMQGSCSYHQLCPTSCEDVSPCQTLQESVPVQHTHVVTRDLPWNTSPATIHFASKLLHKLDVDRFLTHDHKELCRRRNFGSTHCHVSVPHMPSAVRGSSLRSTCYWYTPACFGNFILSFHMPLQLTVTLF